MQSEIAKALSILKKYDLKDTEQALRREAAFLSNSGAFDQESIPAEFVAKSDDEATQYAEKFQELVQFIETALDNHKAELSGILYPVFVHLYLRMVSSDHTADAAAAFCARFEAALPAYHRADEEGGGGGGGHLQQLRAVTRASQVAASPALDGFRSGQYVVAMSRESHQLLKQFLAERTGQAVDSAMEHVTIEDLDGPPRRRQAVESRRGALLGEVAREANRTRVLYAVARDAGEVLAGVGAAAAAAAGGGGGGAGASSLGGSTGVSGGAAGSGGVGGGGGGGGVNGDDPSGSGAGGDGDEEGPKKKKAKKEQGAGKKAKPDPNAPAADRIPLPELRDRDLAERRQRAKELTRRQLLGPQTLPSCCLYTAHNCADERVTACDISEDGLLLCCGTEHSTIKAWALSSRDGLQELLSAEELEKLDTTDDGVHLRMLADKHSMCRQLLGHCGPVYSVSIAPNRQLLVSGSSDTTVRLWSLQLWSCLVVLRGHHEPVWCVRFSPLGHYFASGGADWMARLWATDHPSPLRLFSGHLADVDCVQFHPNGNYVATGCSDGLVRLFDLLNGRCVRSLSGHKGVPMCIGFSGYGRFLISGCSRGGLIVWDLAVVSAGGSGGGGGQLQVAHFAAAHQPGSGGGLLCLAVCRDSRLLATGGGDCSLRLWDLEKLTATAAASAGTAAAAAASAGGGAASSAAATAVTTAASSTGSGGAAGTSAGAASPSDCQFDPSVTFLKAFYTKRSPLLALHFSRTNVLLAAAYLAVDD